MQVRRARSDDSPRLTALYRELVPGDPNVSVTAEQLTELEHDPWNVLLVCERDAIVRGTAFLTICLDVMYRGQPYGLVENVVVERESRRTGVGRALFMEVDSVARARACTKLMLMSAATRTESHEFFAKCGFDGAKKKAFVKYLNRSQGNSGTKNG